MVPDAEGRVRPFFFEKKRKFIFTAGSKATEVLIHTHYH